MELDTRADVSTPVEPGVAVVVARCEPFVVLVLSGEIDVAAAVGLRRRMGDLLAAGDVDVLLDLAEVTFIDSSGLGLLVGAHKKLRAAGGSLGLVSASRPVQRLLTMTALDLVLQVHDSAAAACAGRVVVG